MAFAQNLQTLPSIEGVHALELFDPSGVRQGVIENKPGQAGSLTVYAYLLAKYGAIDRQAAQEGLSLFAEHTEHARLHPGAHPNIDRLLRLEQDGGQFHAQVSYKSAA